MVPLESFPFPDNEKDLSELVQLARDGNKFAFETLYRIFSVPIYKYLLRLVHNREDAEELVQETFIKAWNKLPELMNARQFKSWLYKIATNTAYDRSRKKIIPSMSSAGEIFTGRETEVTFEGQIVERELVNLALKKVPEKLLKCLLLHIEGFSHQEIAEIVDLATKSVGTYISQARVVFRQAYRSLDDE